MTRRDVKGRGNRRPRSQERGLVPHRGWRDTARRSKGRLSSFWRDYRVPFVSCVAFLGLVGLFIGLYSRFVGTAFFDAFLSFYARTTGAVLRLTGAGVSVQGTTIASNRFAFEIVDLCTGIVPTMIFVAAVLAFPSKLPEKLIVALLGAMGIFVVNLIRLVSLFYIGAFVPSVFGATHLLVWQSFMILFSVGIWLLWAQRRVRRA